MTRMTGMATTVVASAFLFSTQAAGDELADLKSQMELIQQDNKAFQQQLSRQQRLIEELVEKIQVLDTTGEAVPEDMREAEMLGAMPTAAEDRGNIFGWSSGPPKVNIQGFTDVTFKAGTERTAGVENNPNSTGALGQFDLFMTSALTDRISFLSEIVFEFNDANATILDVERVQLKYAFSDLLNVAIGRMHTPFGYWNETFHHGAWFQTTATRPDMDRFEDGGGIRPVHNVGVMASGLIPFPAFNFEYDLSVLNGRGKTPEEIQNIQDGNDDKAFNVLLSLAPAAVPGLKFGWHTYLDTFPKDSTKAARDGEIDELILGGYLAYLHDRVELLTEGSHMSHHDQVTQNAYETVCLYIQTAYQLTPKWKPYYRFDLIDFGNGDPFFAPNDIDIARQTVGIRWDVVAWNAIKLEYSYGERDDASDIHLVALQSAFTF